ncbi:RlmF-related methyltransferase, partial [Acinetobacter oleivorans]
VKWFTTLVSKKENVRILEGILKREKVRDYRIVNMQQGNKISRLLVWRF